MTLRGLIFDFDGLILDTEMPVFTAWQELFSQNGFTFSLDNYKRIIGSDNTAYDPAAHLLQLTNGKQDSQTLRERVVTRSQELVLGQSILPGVLEFIQSAYNEGLSLTVASSSSRSWVEGNLSRLGLLDYFSAICTANDVQKVKPDPELFLLAAAKIEVQPSEGIVFEDSPNGITAANAAGIYSIAVPNEITRDMDLSHADRIVNSFLELDPISLIQAHSTN